MKRRKFLLYLSTALAALPFTKIGPQAALTPSRHDLPPLEGDRALTDPGPAWGPSRPFGADFDHAREVINCRCLPVTIRAEDLASGKLEATARRLARAASEEIDRIILQLEPGEYPEGALGRVLDEIERGRP